MHLIKQYTIYKIWRLYNQFWKGNNENDFFFFPFGWFFVFTRFRICDPKCQKNVHENFMQENMLNCI